MINLPFQTDRCWEFIGGCPNSGVANWYVWNKNLARGCRFLGIILIGAGAGGGGGFTKSVGAAGGGGGGGGSGSMVKATFSLDLLPDQLYITLPLGGAGGAANSNGTAGGAAVVHWRPNNSNDRILISGNSNSTPGNAGTGAAAGTGGAASTLATTATGFVSSLALSWQPLVGQAGVNGGAQTGAVGTSITLANVICGGAGGAGSQSADFAGGAITGVGTFPTISGGAAGPNDGGHGLFFNRNPGFPWQTYGGAGGGSSNTAATVGGRGGDGAPGCGGGGGGAGPTGGRGGDGGPAYVLLTAW